MKQLSALGRSSQKLLWKFRIQEARLRIWAREWGLLDDPRHGKAEVRDHHDHKMVSETLLRISELFHDYKRLKSRYGLLMVTDRPPLPSVAFSDYFGDAMSRNIDDMLAEELTNFAKVDIDLQKKRNQTNSVLKKFRLAISDRSKLDLMIRDLRDYNDGLYALLSSVERRQLRQALAPELVTGENVEELQQLAQASGNETTIAPTAELRVKRLRLEAAKSVPRPWGTSSSGLEDLCIPGREIIFDQPASGVPRFQERAIATYLNNADGHNERRTVLVEWKSCDKDLGASLKSEQLSRLDTLARLLHVSSKPAELRVPVCAGYILDDWHPRQRTAPKTLYDGLGGSDVSFLGDRFRLAYELSLSLCLLHTAGWLHKGIRSESVLLLEDQKPSYSDAGHPYLLGFEYSRPDNAKAYSDQILYPTSRSNMYRHPRAQGPARDRFSRLHDIYALGVVLLEIGFWRRSEEFWHKSYTPELFSQDLCDFHAPKLGAKMGKIYMHAVLICLKGDLEAGATGDCEAQTEFFWRVVHPLPKLMA
ncbi:hypothetical protein K469DRAFT_696045 [Zopfia rhizophila CBS 207.26]|uniref:Protein kinase domain-containing protein n=1 Tax=Zopfia rhizophila CBS 207.26 TaxID=1314779 RepID=A0A6A6EPZ0_9PEZI|nr:hypothetical protein K469DRAFT_696045 [Zopfia rhizophila CBS 207.26]